MQTVASTRTLRPNYQYIRAGGLEFVFDFFVELVGPRSSSHLSLWAPRILECQLSSLILCCVSNLPSCKLQPDLKGLLGQLGFRSYGSLLRPAAKFQQAAEVGSGSNRQGQFLRKRGMCNTAASTAPMFLHKQERRCTQPWEHDIHICQLEEDRVQGTHVP